MKSHFTNPIVEIKSKTFSTEKAIVIKTNFQNPREERPSAPCFDALGSINCLSLNCHSTVLRTLLSNNYVVGRGAQGAKHPGF